MSLFEIFCTTIFLISGFIMGVSISYVALAKEDLSNAFSDFKNGNNISFKNIGLRFLNPFILFLLLLPIPKYKDNQDFYSIGTVREKYQEYKSYLKATLIGFLGLAFAIGSLFIYLNIQ